MCKKQNSPVCRFFFSFKKGLGGQNDFERRGSRIKERVSGKSYFLPETCFAVSFCGNSRSVSLAVSCLSGNQNCHVPPI